MSVVKGRNTLFTGVYLSEKIIKNNVINRVTDPDKIYIWSNICVAI